MLLAALGIRPDIFGLIGGETSLAPLTLVAPAVHEIAVFAPGVVFPAELDLPGPGRHELQVAGRPTGPGPGAVVGDTCRIGGLGLALALLVRLDVKAVALVGNGPGPDVARTVQPESVRHPMPALAFAAYVISVLPDGVVIPGNT